MVWFYKGYEFTSADIGDHLAYVYLITDNITGKKYVGLKGFYSTTTKRPTKAQPKKKKVTVESAWMDYVGSNTTFKAIAEEFGVGRFHREILHLCKSRSQAAYLEVYEQVTRNVLLDDTYINGIVACRVNASHIKKYKAEIQKIKGII